MTPVRLAVVGTGLIGARHAELIDANDTCVLAGVCDVDPSREDAARRFGVPFHRSVESLLESERPDGVVVATPNSDHADTAEICAARSVHMLVEKPVADTLDCARRIVRATDRTGVRVLVGYHRRHNPLLRKARELVRGGALGRLLGVSVLWALRKPDAYFDVSWRKIPPGGGPVLINLVHDLDMVRFVCGEATEASARTSSAVRGFEVEDTANVALRLENGAFVTALVSDACVSPWAWETTTGENPAFPRTDADCYRFLGSEASLSFPEMNLWRRRKRDDGWREPIERVQVAVERADPLPLQLEHFIRVVRGTEPSSQDAEDGMRSLALALAVKESARSGTGIDPTSLLDETTRS